MKSYDVTVFAVVKARVSDIQAGSPEEAAKIALERDWHTVFRASPLNVEGVAWTEYDDCERRALLVDEYSAPEGERDAMESPVEFWMMDDRENDGEVVPYPENRGCMVP